MTNCINCGAILTSNKCEYCGTEYKTDKNNNINLKGKTIDDYTVELEINGQVCKFYIADMQVNTMGGETLYGNDGKLKRTTPHTSRKLILVQY